MLYKWCSSWLYALSVFNNFFSVAMREDRYFIAGRAIAVSLVHGGPPAGFLSTTVFSCLVDGPELAKPVLKDVADNDLREKIERVTIFPHF